MKNQILKKIKSNVYRRWECRGERFSERKVVWCGRCRDRVDRRVGNGEHSCGESRGCATGGVATHAGVTGMGMWIQGCGACTECWADAAQTAVGCRGTPSWNARRALPDP